MNITLDGPNWGTSIHLQAVAQILDCWDVIKGEALGLCPKPMICWPSPPLVHKELHPDAGQFAAAKTTWNK